MTMTVPGTVGSEDALDAADRLLLDEAADLIPGAPVVVIGSAALAAAARALGAVSVRVSDDTDASTEPLGADLLGGARFVLVRLPKSLGALERIARTVAAFASPEVVLVSAGRLKYMSRGMNDVLLGSFSTLDVSLARQKSRALTARGPLAVSPPEPARRYDDALGLWVVSVGGVFAGPSVDIGTRAMLAAFDQLPAFETAIDFGCGTGILAAELKRRRPQARVIASDLSADAVASALATAAANALDVEVARDRGLASQPDASIDLIVLNPPFHDGGAVSIDGAHAMFEDARRVLKPGGQLWTVWNSHLGYTGALVRIVGPTTQILRNAKFTVTASTTTSDRLGQNGPATN
jgi:16S rRNA (guanine1207-N2)-methyltransferase